mmetsp:Transcript_67016/g.119210  ORF Transcript_67016/g.119210 Transcript_67016/m.119210 type:complete len:984 (+) Transcript_67016:72-3023(+)
MAKPSQWLWEVVGGRRKSNGGIIVRADRDTASAEMSERLSCGALVRILDKDGGRLQYELISGHGPQSGWVSCKAQGVDLLVKTKKKVKVRKGIGRSSSGSSKPGTPAASDASTQDTETASDEAAEAFKQYVDGFGEARPDEELAMGFNKKAFPWTRDHQVKVNREEVRSQIAQELVLGQAMQGPRAAEPSSTMGDLDIEESVVCSMCHLPLGEVCYRGEKGGRYHGECMAQQVLHDMRREDEERQRKVAAEKKRCHEEYDIGWRPERIPGNAAPAEKLACRSVPEGMTCLVFQDKPQSVRVAATHQPAAAVNLEYLSTALAVRRCEGREPMFSLDPVDPQDRHTMQKKTFEPAWLVGTSLGEVMFQADYYLKELSMGDHEQPVVGMKSCFDYAELEGMKKEWSAREWFMVKKAEVHLSQENVLLPSVRMGVEAREQVKGPQGLEDTAITRKDHPLVKYAQAFTQNFDLIAERRGVVFHLRETAKAAVLAKFLIDAYVTLEDSWFHLAAEKKANCSMEVPQLWNHRVYSQVHVKDGEIVNADKGGKIDARAHGVYGGVQFGLDKFSLSAAPRMGAAASLQSRPGLAAAGLSSTTSSFLRPGVAAGVAQTRLMGQMSATRAAVSLSPGLARPGAMLSAGSTPLLQPKGVDLNLDAFSLSDVKRVVLEMPTPSCGSEFKSLDSCISMGSSFWSSLESDSDFKKEHMETLNAVFNPNLSDRRSEGGRFIPPDSSFSYVQALKALVGREQTQREQRVNHFCSRDFAPGAPGVLFPSSWSSTFEMKVAEGAFKGFCLQPRPDYKTEAQSLQRVFRSVPPIFDKTAEDGMRFRIYRLGSLEMRTTQEYKSAEVVSAVFSVRLPGHAGNMVRKDQSVKGNDRITKATEYVEWQGGPSNRGYFVVLETEHGQRIATELRSDGMTWQECPIDLEDRTSLAKVLRFTVCKDKCATAGEIKKGMESKHSRVVASPSQCKFYAQDCFAAAQCRSHR